MANATIYYTTDGTTPTTNSTLYQGPLTLSSSETVQAIAVAPGYVPSGIATVSFNIMAPPPAPTFSVPSGTYNQAQTVSITDNSLGSYIYYTNDGTTPVPSSPRYTGPITVSSSETINALAAMFGYGVYEGSLTQFDGLTETGGATAGPDATAVYTINLAPPSFAINDTAVTVTPGATTGNTSTVTLTPSGGFIGTVNLSCAITPADANVPATCTIPTSVTISGASAQTTTLTVNTTAATSAYNPARKFLWPSAGDAAFACILLIGIEARRRKLQTILGTLMMLFFIAGGLVACGGGGNNGASGGGGGGGNPGTTPGTYTITVTGTSGTITETGTVTLTVQ